MKTGRLRATPMCQASGGLKIIEPSTKSNQTPNIKVQMSLNEILGTRMVLFNIFNEKKLS